MWFLKPQKVSFGQNYTMDIRVAKGTDFYQHFLYNFQPRKRQTFSCAVSLAVQLTSHKNSFTENGMSFSTIEISYVASKTVQLQVFGDLVVGEERLTGFCSWQ